LRPQRSNSKKSQSNLRTSREEIHHNQLPFCLESALRPLRSLCTLSVQTLKNPNQTSREKIYHNQLPFCRESALRPLRSLCALSVQTLKNLNQISELAAKKSIILNFHFAKNLPCALCVPFAPSAFKP